MKYGILPEFLRQRSFMCNHCNTCNSCNSCNCACNNVRRALNNLFSTDSWCGCGCGCNSCGCRNARNGCNSCGCNSCGESFSTDLSAFTNCCEFDAYYARQYALFRNDGCGCNSCHSCSRCGCRSCNCCGCNS